MPPLPEPWPDPSPHLPAVPPAARRPPLQLQAPCSFPEGQRYFPLAVAMDNLTSCSREGNHAGRWAARFGELIQTPTWVDSQQGARWAAGGGVAGVCGGGGGVEENLCVCVC